MKPSTRSVIAGLAYVAPESETIGVVISSRQAASLFSELRKQSNDVHRRLLDGRAFGVEQHEETITESLLLELQRAQPNILVRTYTRWRRAERAERIGRGGGKERPGGSEP